MLNRAQMEQAGMSLREALELMKLQDEMEAKDNPDCFIMSLTTNLEHWHGYEIYTVAQLNHYLDYEC